MKIRPRKTKKMLNSVSVHDDFDSSKLLLDDIYNSDDPEIKRFMNRVRQEEIRKIDITASDEEKEKEVETACDRILIRMAWRFKDKLSPRMQQILVEQYPCPEPEQENYIQTQDG